MLLRVLIALILLTGIATAAPWSIDPETAISVDVKWTGGTVRVAFPEYYGTIAFDESAPEQAHARITVSAGQATTGIAPVDSLMRGEGYLDAARHPEVTFSLDRLTQTSRSTADVAGRLTLRGVTRPLALKATVLRYGPAKDDPARFEAGFDLTGVIDRSDYGSVAGSPDIATILPIHIRLLMHSNE